MSTFAPLLTASSTSSSRSVRPCSVASGPTSVASSVGSPMTRPRNPSVKASTNWSYTSAWMMNRFAAIQDWPLFCTRAVTAVFAAAAMSALGMTMKGSLPPSSSTVCLTSSPAIAATDRPAGSLPVKVAAATRGSRRIDSIIPEPIRSVWKQPSGKPARCRTSSRYRADCGTLEACLRMPTLPAISAGAANRTACQRGKFHGMIASTTPSG